MKLHVHLLGDFDKAWTEQLQSELDDAIHLSHGEPVPSAVNVLVAGLPKREHVVASDKLQSLVIPWAGLPKPTRELMLDFPDIAIYNLHHNAAATAEMAVTLMLAAAKRIVSIDRTFRKHDWTARYEDSRSPLLAGKTAVILGYGAIGRRIARFCHGLGMHVHVIKREAVDTHDQYARLHESGSIVTAMAGADVLFVCVPLTPETTGLIGERELSLLAEDAVVVNIARGRVIDEAALYHALKAGHIHAGLDVWYFYPQDEASRVSQPPSEYPFHELDNVVMTPHVAGHSIDIETLRRHDLAQLLNSLAHGVPPSHRVDPQRGY